MTSFGSNTYRDDRAAEIPLTARDVRRIACFSACASVALFLAALVAYGCATKPVLPGIPEAGEASGRIELRAEQIGDDAEKVKPRTDAIGKVHVARIEDNAEAIIEDVGVQRKAHAEAVDAYAAMEAKHAKLAAAHTALLHRWYVKLGSFVDRIIVWAKWLTIGAFVGAIAFRFAAMFVGGWTGTTLAKIGSVILSAFPGGGYINEFFTNAYYVDRAAKLNPAA